MTIAIISHPDCLLHDAGDLHPERPDRVKVVQAAIQGYSFDKPLKFYEAPLAHHNHLISVHDQHYVDEIIALGTAQTNVVIDEDTAMNKFTLSAALRAAGAVVYAVDLVMRKEAKVAFCNVRPPGHHAERDRAMGFCFFNNVAVGAMHAILEYDLQRIAIVDFDVHHGNGTQNIFQNDPRVMYCSSFEYPFYPGYSPELDNQHIIGVPLEAGTLGQVFRQKVKRAWFEKIAEFKPQLIFISAGFDAHSKDLMANVRLEEADFVWLTKQIAALAEEYCDGKIVSVLEGGYNLSALSECVPAHINALV